MSAATPAVHPESLLSEVVSTMRRHHVRELPVVDAERHPLGMLTEADLQPYRGHLEWTQVRTAMSSPPITIAPQAGVGDAVRLLLAFGLNALPVVDDGRLVGMVRRHDALSLLLTDGF